MKAFVLISLNEGAEKEVFNYLKKFPQVRNVHYLFGEWDLLAEVEMLRTEELGTFVIDKIRSRDEVKLTSSLIVAGP